LHPQHRDLVSLNFRIINSIFFVSKDSEYDKLGTEKIQWKMKETQEKARVARVKEQLKAQVRVQVKKGARALVRVARVKEQDKAQDREARETGAKEQVKDLGKKAISKKRLT
jgi:hypothetical protein